MSTGKVFLAMKNLRKISVVLFVLLSYSCATQSPVSAQRGYVDSQVFYDQLSPYGEWVDYPNYGYVWIPDVDQDFSPYSTSGYWVMTDYGWTWVSDYPWGWAPFHYGRWDYDNYYGWFWVPDYEWGPSWVTWRSGNGYYGWTPMRPGISISLSFGYEYRDLDRWNFVRDRDFGRSDIYRYYVDRSDYNTIINNSTVINNTYIDQSRNATYIAGPSRSDVQQVTGRRISNISVRDNDRPGQVLKNSQLQIYRPQIQKTSGGQGQRPAPSRITNLKDVRPARERNAPDQRSKVAPIENNRREQQQSQPQRQVERQRQSQPQQQIEKRNQEQQQQPQNQRRQEQQQLKQQQQLERQKQQQQQQQDQRNQQQQQDQQNQRNQQQQQDQQNQRSQQQQQSERQKQQQQAQPVQQQAQPVQQREQQKQNVTEPSGNKRQERQQKAAEAKENRKNEQSKGRNR